MHILLLSPRQCVVKTKLICGDCTQLLPKIPSNSVDCTFTSPPYNMNLRIMGGKFCKRTMYEKGAVRNTKYVETSDCLSMDEYYEFNVAVIDQLLRVSKLTFYNVQFLTGNKSALYKIIGKYSNNIKEFIVWDKINGQPAIGDSVLNSVFEVILVFAPQEDAISRQFKVANFERGTLDNIIRTKHSQSKTKTHGATFPRSLTKLIVGNFSNKGDIILDPFMGTGTTGVVAKSMGRRFIGIECDKSYYDFATNQIDSVGRSLFTEE